MGETYALLPAAGRGERFRRNDPAGGAPSGVSHAHLPSANKLLTPLAGKPVLAHTLLAFEGCGEIDGILLVGSADALEDYRLAAELAGIRKPIRFVEGGSTRQESVARGLDALPDSAEIVAIHDAARPLVTPELIARTIREAQAHGAALAALPLTDTVKRVGADGHILDTLPRSELYAAQTPQTFRVPLIREAHARAVRDGVDATDDAALVERLGRPVIVVPGDRRNLKVTTPEDLIVAEAFWGVGCRVSGVGETQPASSSMVNERETPPYTLLPTPYSLFRVGFGYDIHRLAEGRRLVLGGVEIPHSLGLDGHSDADVLLHALMDALLGAAGMPDIGHLFPNTEERWRGASSRALLREVAGRLAQSGWRPSNVDLTLIAERPKIAPYLDVMRAAIAEDLDLPGSAVGIKATTNERVGAVGREEAMEAQAVAMLVPATPLVNSTVKPEDPGDSSMTEPDFPLDLF